METNIEKELTLRDAFQTFRRRRNIVYGWVGVLFLLAGLYCAMCTRRYEASATVQVQKENSDIMGLDSLMSGGGEGATDALNGNIDLQTQANILQSDTLALQTIEALKMEQTYDFKPRFNPVGWVLGLIAPKGEVDTAGVRLEDAPQRRQRALKTFSKNLQVKPISGTRLIEISYTNPDPKLAAAVVNTLTKALADYTFQTRYDATNQASRWLSDQMGDLRKTSQELQAKVVDLQRESGVYSLGVSDGQGREQAYSGVLDRLQQVTGQLTAAQQNRILKGAIARAADSGDAEMLSGLAGNSFGNMQMNNNSLGLLQNLRQQEATQQAALQEAETKFGPSYPKLAEIRGSLAGLQRAIREETERIRQRAKSDFAVAVQTESSVRAEYDRAKQQADVLNNKAIDFAIAREEADQSRSLYQDLLKRLNEAGVLAGLKSSNITVVDPGRIPAKPKTPNVPLYLAVSLMGGLFLGCTSALVVEALDNKVNTVSDLENEFGISTLGVLPQVVEERRPTIEAGSNAHSTALIAVKEPQSTFIESLRAIRTGVLLSQGDAPPKVILVTSSLAGEGKSTTSINLAVVLAQTGRKTLIVDTDLRRGTLRNNLRLQPGRGLSDLLAGVTQTPAIQVVPGIPNLDVLAAGTSSPNPSELLSSDAIRTWLNRWREEYDFIVLDSAPVLPVTDSVTLNTMVDVTLLIARVGVTEKPQVCRSFQLLRRDGKHYVGLVLNGLSVKDDSYYGYYGYRKNAYPYHSREDSNA